MSLKLTRRQYMEMYGPTIGDQVRLGTANFSLKLKKI